MDKAHLQAFVDGELSPEEAAAVVMHLADHPEDQAYVDDLMAANQLLARAFGAPLQEPVPEAIMNTIFPPEPKANVLPFVTRKGIEARRLGLAAGGLAALAAAVALIVALQLGAPDPTRLAVGSVSPGAQLHDLLQTAATGEARRLETGEEAVILATMPSDSGYCREVELVDRDDVLVQLALACGKSGSWSVEVVFAEALPAAVAEDGFLPASGEEAALMATWLDRQNAGAALPPDQEQAALAKGWR